MVTLFLINLWRSWKVISYHMKILHLDYLVYYFQCLNSDYFVSQMLSLSRGLIFCWGFSCAIIFLKILLVILFLFIEINILIYFYSAKIRRLNIFVAFKRYLRNLFKRILFFQNKSYLTL